MTDKIIEARRWLRWSGDSLASCSAAVRPLLHWTLDLIRSVGNGQLVAKCRSEFTLFKTICGPIFAVHPTFDSPIININTLILQPTNELD